MTPEEHARRIISEVIAKQGRALDVITREISLAVIEERERYAPLKNAAMQALDYIEADEFTHGRNFDAGDALRAALKSNDFGA